MTAPFALCETCQLTVNIRSLCIGCQQCRDCCECEREELLEGAEDPLTQELSNTFDADELGLDPEDD